MSRHVDRVEASEPLSVPALPFIVGEKHGRPDFLGVTMWPSPGFRFHFVIDRRHVRFAREGFEVIAVSPLFNAMARRSCDLLKQAEEAAVKRFHETGKGAGDVE